MSAAWEPSDGLAQRGPLSGEEIAILAERTARDLVGVSLEEALAMLDRGELRGSMAESALRSVRVLLDSE